jgi:hypothetical protein
LDHIRLADAVIDSVVDRPLDNADHQLSAQSRRDRTEPIAGSGRGADRRVAGRHFGLPDVRPPELPDWHAERGLPRARISAVLM